MPTSWTYPAKPSTSWTEVSKPGGDQFLLLETGDFLLLETGDKIMLEQSGTANTPWTYISKP